MTRIQRQIAAVCTALAAGFAPALYAAKYDPGAGKTLLLIGQTYQAEYTGYVSGTSKAPAGSSHYGTLYLGTIEQGDDQNANAFLNYIDSTYPGAYAQVALSMKDNPGAGGCGTVQQCVQRVANGDFDAQVDKIAAILKARPNLKFLVRIDYEVSLGVFGNATSYINAYNRVANRIRNVNGVSNVDFVYHPVRGFGDAQSMYPGSTYVDWVGLSVFNNDICLPVGGVSNCSGQSVDPNLQQVMDWARNTLNKPLIVSESAVQPPSSSSTSGFNDYLTRLFNLVKNNDVRALVYINSNWTAHGWSSDTWGDSRVEVNSTVRSAWLNEVNAARYVHYAGSSPGDTTPPTVPGGLAVGSATANSLTLSWTAASDNLGVTGYEVFRNGNSVGTPSGTSFVDSGLAASTSYSYQVRARDAAGNWSARSATVSGSTLAGGGGGGGSGSFGIDSAAKFYHVDGGHSAAWNYLCLNSDCRPGTKTNGRYERAVAVSVGSSYNIEFKVQDNATGQCLSGVQAVVYASAGVSAPSACASGGGGGGGNDSSPPSVPGNLSVGSATASSLSLSWSASSDNVGVSKYEVYRNAALIASPASTSYTDAGLAAATTYSYTVRACDAAGNCSAQTAARSGTTLSGGGGGSSGNFGIDAAAKLYHVDKAWSASWNYLCLNGDCRPGSKTGGRFERSVSVSAGSSYSIEFKVQDNASGQCLSGQRTVTYLSAGVSTSSACAP